jgi:hypothetical protein
MLVKSNHGQRQFPLTELSLTLMVKPTGFSVFEENNFNHFEEKPFKKNIMVVLTIIFWKKELNNSRHYPNF